jgi:DNA gyrase subunit A
VKFVTPKKGDAVAVVARSVEAREDEEEAEVVEGATIEASESPTESPTEGADG